MANETPSGYAPHILINIVITPQPIPNTICPQGLMGEDTISVAMKKAPSIKPPVNR